MLIAPLGTNFSFGTPTLEPQIWYKFNQYQSGKKWVDNVQWLRFTFRPWWCHQMEHFPRYWPFVWGIYRSPVNSPDRGQWRGALVFCLVYARTNSWVNNREAGDLRRHRTHNDVGVMNIIIFSNDRCNSASIKQKCRQIVNFRGRHTRAHFWWNQFVSLLLHFMFTLINTIACVPVNFHSHHIKYDFRNATLNHIKALYLHTIQYIVTRYVACWFTIRCNRI